MHHVCLWLDIAPSRRQICLAVLLLCLTLVAHSSSRTITYNRTSNDNETYSLELLKIALSYQPGKYVFEPTETILSQSKQLEDINFGGIQVFWMGTSKELEDAYRPIRIPLFKGLLGNRIFIIRPDRQPRFSQVESLEGLRKLTLGQGQTWADTAILRAADLSVVTSFNYPNLFYMLEGRRFDGFPRGVHEPWSEVERHADLNLSIETDLMLVYRMPLYFFVAKDDIQLAQDIESGLEYAISDGTFDKHFFENPMIKAVLQKANMDQRKAFHINNPFAHPDTPVDRAELWYN